jgi:hypothetical protein
VDDTFPDQLDLQIEHTRGWPARQQLHMLLLEARKRLASQADELAELQAALTATYELHGIWPDGDEQPDVVPDRIVFVAEDGERADFFVVDGRPLLNAVIDRAEARAFTGPLSVWATWEDGAELPADVGLSDPDGDPIDVELSATGLINEVRRRQAKTVIRRHELSDPLGPELGAVLALVDATHALRVDEGDHRPFEAGWESWDEIVSATGATREAAILAATAKLLGLDEGSLRRRVTGLPAAVVKAAMALVDEWQRWEAEHEGHPYSRTETELAFLRAVEQLRGATVEPRPRTCRSCVHFERDAPRAASGDGSARPCIAHDSLLTHPGGGAECADYAPDTDPAPQLPGVEIEGNLVRSEGGDDA